MILDGTLYDKIALDLGEDRDWVKNKFMTALLYTPNNSVYTLKDKKFNKSKILSRSD